MPPIRLALREFDSLIRRFVLPALLLAAALPAPLHAETADWNAFVQEFIDGYFEIDPPFAVSAGRHEFDGRLPDWSAAGLKRSADWLRAQQQRAAAFTDTQLNEAQRFERDYLVAVADGELFWIETSGAPYHNPMYYADALDPDVYVVREYAPLKDRMLAYTAFARAVPRAVEQIRANLRAPLPPTISHIGHVAFGGFAAFFADDVPAIFAEVKDEALQAEFGKANAAAIAALSSLDEWFTAQKEAPGGDFALGAERYRKMLWMTERVDTPLDELRRIGEQDLERNIAAMQTACAKFAPGVSIPECVSRVDRDKPADSPVLEARRQLDQLKQFLVAKQLASIPGTEEALVDESPPYKRYNSAYISIPGPYERGLPSVYYIAPPDPNWTPEEQQAYIPGRHMLLFTSVHEIWPGHFLQFLHANRSPSRFGQVFVGYAFAEGWAHYSEELMLEAGLGEGDARYQIGQLNQALLRNVRYLSSLGMHTAGMSTEESERMFREKAFQDPGTSRQQAARGTFDPAYLNYTLGKLMIRKLRADWSAGRGGRAAWQQFHDAFLGYGGPPIPLVRKAMLGAESGPLF